MRLGVPASPSENIGHSGPNAREVVCIDLKLVPKLQLPIVKSRVSTIS